jgi:hypothetical protein
MPQYDLYPNHQMNRSTIQFVAIPAVFLAIFFIVLSKFNDSEEVTAVVNQVASTKPRIRETPTETAIPKNRIRKENSVTTAGDARYPSYLSEEYWKDLLKEVQTNDEFNDREMGSELIMIASNPIAPERIREKAIADALVFIDDENYEHDIKPLAIRMDLPDSIHNIILEDLLNRPQPTALPLARYISNTNGHLLAEVLGEYVESHE